MRTILILAMLIGACTPAAEEPANGQGDARSAARGAAFLCPNGTRVTVVYRSGDIAEVRVGERPPIKLPRAMSGSGARHADGRNEIWEAKGALRVKLADGTSLENCVMP